MTWSFSSVNCYAQCPKMFKMSYIDCLSKSNNAFAEWGSFGHLLLEKYYNGEMEFFELSQAYEGGYRDNVKLSFPPNAHVNLNKSYYEAGKLYFDQFEGGFDDCEILGVEQKINIEVGKYKFVGYIDLILRDPEGNIFICDHKSKSKFKNKKEKREYLHQLYLYSIYIYEKYGVYPSKLVFNMFRVGNFEEEIFSLEELEKSKKWFIKIIETIYLDVTFKSKPDDFFCNWLCSVKHHCSCSDKYICG